MGRQLPEQQLAFDPQAPPLGRQQVPEPPQLAPFVVQQSKESRQVAPTGPHAQVPLVQIPLQQSDATEQTPPTEAQQRPF